MKIIFGSPFTVGLALSQATGRTSGNLVIHTRTSLVFNLGEGFVLQEVARGATPGATGWVPGMTDDPA